MDFLKNNTPSGTRDLIFEEIESRNRLESSLGELYKLLGYRQICTPTVEFYDTFNRNTKYIDEESMYKLTDLDGRLIVLRPDNTAPMARVVASKLKNESSPIKIFYNQAVFLSSKKYNARQNEIFQSGVEIIGGGEESEDLGCLFTALCALERCDENFKIEIGHSAFFDALCDPYSLSEEERANLKKYVSAKNSADYCFSPTPKMEKMMETARILPTLCGKKEALERARALARGNDRASGIIAYIEKIYTAFTDAGYGDKILFDFGIVQKMDYYTGIVFRGYIEGIGTQVLSGGRYDNLQESFGGMNCSSCGFAINLSEIAESKKAPACAPAGGYPTFERGAQSITEAKEYVRGAKK